MAALTVPIAIRIRTAQAAYLEASPLRAHKGALITVLLSLYISGKLDNLGIEEYLKDEIGFREMLSSKKGQRNGAR